MVYSARSEQGFAVRCHGEPDRRPVDFEGLVLMRYVGKQKSTAAP